ncbi:LPXTG cell wall anchor domain-containing protein [Nostoc sp. PA-18-2419]|uniref:LPXTG cell wall anchor domain-containing protein n=1 Tax=Nostoc sp. PA-18-2419 TaxID=2575443 RepID=UPI0011093C33|nr:LPXTG cell wall anchor domain-containing protein [Nostoc sp. PA-18-2419]
MLVRKRNEDPHSVSPFSFEGLAQTPQQQKIEQPSQPQPLPENNRGRTFRRAGNACEIVAGSCLNSGVIFTFHLLQVHPVGMFLAVGTAHLYFTATATGEGFNNFVTNLMTGCSASLALLCALNEPISEWNESRTSTSTVKASIESVYKPKTAESSSWMSGAGVGIFLAILMIFLFRGKSK